MGIYGVEYGESEHLEQLSEAQVEREVLREMEQVDAVEAADAITNDDQELDEIMSRLRQADSKKIDEDYQKQLRKLDAEKSQKGEDAKKQSAAVNKSEKTAEMKKHKEESIITRLLSDTKSKDAKKDIVKQAFSKGFEATMKAKEEVLKGREQQLVKRFEDLVYGKKDSVKDQIMLSKRAAEQKIIQKKEDKKDKQNSIDKHHNKLLDAKKEVSDSKPLQQAQATRQAKSKQTGQAASKYVAKFAQAYVRTLYSDKPQNRRQVKEIKKEMVQVARFSTKQVAGVERLVGQAVKSHMAYGMKKHLLRLYFNRGAGRLIDAAQDKTNVGELAKSLLKMEGLAHFDIQSLFPDVNHQLQKGMESFAIDEMRQQMSQVQLGQMSEEDYEKTLKQLVVTAKGMGVVIDVNELTDQVITGLEHQGFEILSGSILASAQSGASSQNSDHSADDSPKYVNQQELLEDKLRHLYMVLALNPNLKDQVEIQYKMKKLKNGLLKLGISVGDELAQDGIILAQIKCVDALKENFREQAGIHPLDGDDYQIIKKKRAVILKNLKELGYKVRRADLEKIRSKANLEIAPTIREQIDQLEVAISIRRTPYLYQRFKHYVEHLDRLKSESELLQHFKPVQKIEKHIESMSSFQELA